MKSNFQRTQKSSLSNQMLTREEELLKLLKGNHHHQFKDQQGDCKSNNKRLLMQLKNKKEKDQFQFQLEETE